MKLGSIFAGIAGSSLAMGALAVPSVAAAGMPKQVGTWMVADRGQGAWAGGTLRADGSVTGSGQFAFTVTPGVEEVAAIQPVSWSYADPSHDAILLNATVTGKQGPVFPIGVPIQNTLYVPISAGAPVPLTYLSPDTYAKVVINHP